MYGSIKYLLKVAVQTLGLVNNDGIKYIIVMSNSNKRERKGTKSYSTSKSCPASRGEREDRRNANSSLLLVKVSAIRLISC